MSPQLTSLAIDSAASSDGSAGCAAENNDGARATSPGPAVETGGGRPLVYPGGKGAAGVHQLIINHIPPHKLFVEPFLGAGNIMLRKRPAVRDVGVDVSGDTISAALRRFALRPSCQFFVADAIGVLESLSAQLATAAVVASFSDPRGSSLPATMAMAATSDDSFRNVTANLMAQACATGNGGGIMPTGMAAGDVVVYCDPPYLMSTRKSGRRLYAIEPSIDTRAGAIGDEAWHRRLLDVLNSLPCYVLLSGYWSELYDTWLRPPKWRHCSYKVRTRGGQTVTEYLWCNFPEPMELHDYSYLGINRRERERIKRKKQRFAHKLLRMPTLERYAVLSAIRDAVALSTD